MQDNNQPIKSSNDQTGSVSTKVSALFDKKYEKYLGDRYFECSVAQTDREAELKVILRNATESFFYPVEAQVDVREYDINFPEAYELMMDFVDSYFEEFFREGEHLYLPIDWKPYSFENIQVRIRGQIFNNELEKMADALLQGEALIPNS